MSNRGNSNEHVFTPTAFMVVREILAGDIQYARALAVGASFTLRDQLEISIACRKWGVTW